MNALEGLFHAPVSATILVITLITSIRAEREPQLKENFIFHPVSVLQHREWYRLFTSGLIHGGWMHLAFNMLAFYFFAFSLEQYYLGPWRMALLYGLSLGLSSLPALYRHRDNPAYRALGASGAVSAVVLSMVVFNPTIGIGLLFIPGYIPGWLFAILYMGFSFVAGLKQWGNIGHEAHLFGAIAGIILTVVMRPEAVQMFMRQLEL
jgi:membrane associated rhomboid family serine protease